jgi:hypothetical protein
VYPLIDTETSTEPVPIYKGSRPPVPTRQVRWRLVIGLVALAALVLAGILIAYRK